MSRLRTIAGTFLITSALWLAGFVYWTKDVYPAPSPQARPETLPLASEQAAYRPVHAPPVDASDMPVMIIPVEGVGAGQLSDTFSQARANGARVHDAIDIMAPRGTPVLAATNGTVEKLFTSAAGGLTIYIRAQDRRFIHYYAHLDTYAAGLHEGQQVRQGEVIGAVGSTGNVSPDAPHLHFAVQVTSPEAKWYEPSTAINPFPLLTRR